MVKRRVSADMTVSTTELAIVLGLTGRRVQQLAQDGVIMPVRRGQYPLGDSVQRYMGYLSRQASGGKDTDLEKEKHRAEVTLKVAKAEMARLEMKELQSKIHRAEDVKAMTEDLIYTIRSALMALPGRLAVDVCAAQTAAEASEVIRKEVYLVMGELSEYRYDPKRYEERVKSERV